jgi:hypothetical protein
MRCYLVSTVVLKKYVGTRADATATKKEWVANNVSKAGIKVEEVEIPLAKADLLEFINKLVGVVP